MTGSAGEEVAQPAAAGSRPGRRGEATTYRLDEAGDVLLPGTILLPAGRDHVPERCGQHLLRCERARPAEDVLRDDLRIGYDVPLLDLVVRVAQRSVRRVGTEHQQQAGRLGVYRQKEQVGPVLAQR